MFRYTLFIFFSLFGSELFSSGMEDRLVEQHSSTVRIENTSEDFLGNHLRLDELDELKEYFYDGYVNQDHKIRNVFSTVSALLTATSGAFVLSWFSYLFFAERIHGGKALGVIGATVTTISPWLGFVSVTKSNIESILSLERMKCDHVKLFLSRDIIEGVLISIPSIVTTMPLVFVTYKAMFESLDHFTWLFMAGTFSVFMQYYNKTSRSFVRLIQSKCKKEKCLVISYLDEIQNEIKKAADEKLEECYDVVMNNNGRNALVEILGLSRLFEENGRNENTLNNNGELQRPVENKCLTLKHFVSTVGAFCGFLGAYYFFRIGEDEVKDDLPDSVSQEAKIALYETAGVLTFICRGVFGAVTGFSSFGNVYQKVKDNEILTRSSAFLLFMALTGAVSSTDMALAYLGSDFWGCFWTTFTTIALVSAGYWGQELFFNSLGYVFSEDKSEAERYITKVFSYLISIQRSDREIKRRILMSHVSDLRDLFPYIKKKEVLNHYLQENLQGDR